MGIYLGHLALKHIFELPSNIGIFHSVFLYLIYRHSAHRTLGFPFANKALDSNRRIVQVGFAEDIHIVAHIGVEQVMSYHRIEECALYLNTVVLQYFEVVFQILTYFGYLFILKKRTELLYELSSCLFFFRKWQIIPFMGCPAEGNPH